MLQSECNVIFPLKTIVNFFQSPSRVTKLNSLDINVRNVKKVAVFKGDSKIYETIVKLSF